MPTGPVTAMTQGTGPWLALPPANTSNTGTESSVLGPDGCLERPGDSRRFDQFHLPIASAVENLNLAFAVAEDKNVPIAKVRLFHGFFQCHRTHRHRIRCWHDVHFGGFTLSLKLVYNQGNGGSVLPRRKNSRWRIVFHAVASHVGGQVPIFHVLRMPRLGPRASAMLQRLLFQMPQ